MENQESLRQNMNKLRAELKFYHDQYLSAYNAGSEFLSGLMLRQYLIASEDYTSAAVKYFGTKHSTEETLKTKTRPQFPIGVNDINLN